MLDDRRLTANHHAVATLETPDASARPHVHVVDALRGQLLRATDVVDVVRIAAVDQDVVPLEQRDQIVDARIHDRCRDHQPEARGLLSFPTSSLSDAAPCAPSDASSATAPGLRSYTTQA